MADNLSTTSNNVVELRPVHLGLAADEYLTEFTVHFGQVPAGFTAVDKAPAKNTDISGLMPETRKSATRAK